MVFLKIIIYLVIFFIGFEFGDLSAWKKGYDDATKTYDNFLLGISDEQIKIYRDYLKKRIKEK